MIGGAIYLAELARVEAGIDGPSRPTPRLVPAVLAAGLADARIEMITGIECPVVIA